MYIYAFGSTCRGEIDKYSDVDLLAIIEPNDKKYEFNMDSYSVYNLSRIKEIWEEGNPFAWHLYQEAKLIYSTSKQNLFEELKKPNKYKNVYSDCEKFYRLYTQSTNSLIREKGSEIFDLSTLFLAIRNFATCYSLGIMKIGNFSRFSAKKMKENSIDISDNCYSILERARILSTRGQGKNISNEEINLVMNELDIVSNWFSKLKKKYDKRFQ